MIGMFKQAQRGSIYHPMEIEEEKGKGPTEKDPRAEMGFILAGGHGLRKIHIKNCYHTCRKL
jgi:hypothetical protein